MMRRFSLATFVTLTVASAALAFELGNQAPQKSFHPASHSPASPEALRQGGDTIDDAFVIDSLPFQDTGTTAGYNHDYAASWGCCPQGPGPAPDVCYLFTPSTDMQVTVDLCGSAHDTQVYIHDPDGEEVACNDDYYFGPPCGNWVSKIESAPLAAGITYLIVVDGFWGSEGEYIIEVDEYVACDLDVPAGAYPEGEPPLADGYEDFYNGGCNSPEFGTPFQELVGDAEGQLTFAGIGGWYRPDGGSSSRDTDWFLAEVGETGLLELTFTAEVRSYLFELAPQDCETVEVAQSWEADDCETVQAQVSAEPGATVWLWVGSSTIEPPQYWDGNEYDYLLEISGLATQIVTVQPSSWSMVKGLFR